MERSGYGGFCCQDSNGLITHAQGTRTHLPSSYQVFVEFIGRERFSKINV